MPLKQILAVFLALLLLFSVVVVSPKEAKANQNTLTVYKVINGDKTKRINDLSDEHFSLEQLQKKGEAISGSPLYLYRVSPKAEKKVLDSQSIKELGEPLQKVLTDDTGQATFTQLPNGNYYVRDASEQGYVTVSFLTLLPAQSTGGKMNHVTRYAKVWVPEKGGKPPADEPSKPKAPLKQVFKKIDNSTPANPLAGSKFKVVKGIKKDGKIIYETMQKEGKDYVVMSGKDGIFAVEGIPQGTYYLVETEAPEVSGVKYKLLDEPYRFQLTSSSVRENPVYIRNVPLTVPSEKPPSSDAPLGRLSKGGNLYLPKTLPKTGDIGFLLFFLAGSGMLFLGRCLYCKN